MNSCYYRNFNIQLREKCVVSGKSEDNIVQGLNSTPEYVTSSFSFYKKKIIF